MQLARVQSVVALRAGHPMIVTCVHYHMTVECHGTFSNMQQEKQEQPCKQGHAHASAIKLGQLAEAAFYLLCVLNTS